MAIILHVIETATKSCSVAISEKGVLLGHKEEHPQSYVHSEKLTKHINDLLRGVGIAFSEIDAISLSSGPGSYTGLRIGSSTAKGLCFALKIPLISVPTLKSLDSFARKKGIIGNICVMLDARRMEVYSLISSSEIKVLKKLVQIFWIKIRTRNLNHLLPLVMELLKQKNYGETEMLNMIFLSSHLQLVKLV